MKFSEVGWLDLVMQHQGKLCCTQTYANTHTHYTQGRAGMLCIIRKCQFLCLHFFVAHSWLLTWGRVGTNWARGRLRNTVREWAIKWMKMRFPLCPLCILSHLQIIQHQSWTPGDLSLQLFPVLPLIYPSRWALGPLYIRTTHLAVCI